MPDELTQDERAAIRARVDHAMTDADFHWIARHDAERLLAALEAAEARAAALESALMDYAGTTRMKDIEQIVQEELARLLAEATPDAE